METILARHSENLSIPILTPGSLACNRASILAIIPLMKLKEHSKSANKQFKIKFKSEFDDFHIRSKTNSEQ
jgi:hypothetical protein